MNRLSSRLVLSHVLVAVLGALATFLIVRQLAPALFDETLRRTQTGGPRGPGSGPGPNAGLRSSSPPRSVVLLTGALIGAGCAHRHPRGVAVDPSAGQPAQATRQIAEGRYDTTVAVPKEAELADLANDVNSLGRSPRPRRVGSVCWAINQARTPLTVIDGYVEGMLDQCRPPTPVAGAGAGREPQAAPPADDLSALSEPRRDGSSSARDGRRPAGGRGRCGTVARRRRTRASAW